MQHRFQILGRLTLRVPGNARPTAFTSMTTTTTTTMMTATIEVRPA